MAARQTITGFARRGAPRGFTLIELLVVMGIIVVMAAFAVPTYHFIMGNRSLGAAENMIAAMVGRARSQAIGNQRYAGVAFFYNPATGRSSMAIVVERAPGSLAEEDPYFNYRGWSDVQWNSSSAPQYLAGQEVYDLQIDTSENRRLFRRFHALKNASGSDQPELYDPNGDNSYWQVMRNSNVTFIDFVAEGEIQPLPQGVGVQLINDPDPNKRDRYVRTGVILFDAEGRLVSKEITIDRNGELGRLINNTPLGVTNNDKNLDVPEKAAKDFYSSQLGVVLYDQEAFKSQDGFTETDLIAPLGAKPNVQDELREEEWLDQNAMQLLFSRHNGTVLRGE